MSETLAPDQVRIYPKEGLPYVTPRIHLADTMRQMEKDINKVEYPKTAPADKQPKTSAPQTTKADAEKVKAQAEIATAEAEKAKADAAKAEAEKAVAEANAKTTPTKTKASLLGKLLKDNKVDAKELIEWVEKSKSIEEIAIVMKGESRKTVKAAAGERINKLL